MAFPAPDAPLVMVTHAAEDDAVQEQPDGDVTVTAPVVASEATAASVGEIV